MADEQLAVEVPDESVVTIEVPDDGTPVVEAKKTPEPEPAPKKQSEPRVRIKEQPSEDPTKALQETIDNERKLRQAAEQTALSERQRAESELRQRQQREQELAAAHEDAGVRHLQYIDNEIANSNRELEAYQNEERAALEAGNFEKVAEISTKKMKAAAKLDRFESQKADYEAQRQRFVAPTTEGRVTEQQPVNEGDAFSRYVSGFAPAAQAWLRAHPECVPAGIPGGNATANAKMMKGHYEALSRNLVPNSEEYFKVIEEATGHRKPEVAAKEEVVDDTPPPPTKQQQKPLQRTAAPTREPPGSPQTGRTRSVTLNKDEMEAARFSMPHLTPQQAYAEYAKNKLELESEGKLGRTTH